VCLLRGTDWVFVCRLNVTKVVVKGFKFHTPEAELLDVLRLPDSVGRTELQAGYIFQMCHKILLCGLLHVAVQFVCSGYTQVGL
jgi:hypothetical protein